MKKAVYYLGAPLAVLLLVAAMLTLSFLFIGIFVLSHAHYRDPTYNSSMWLSFIDLLITVIGLGVSIFYIAIGIIKQLRKKPSKESISLINRGIMGLVICLCLYSILDYVDIVYVSGPFGLSWIRRSF